MNQRLLEGEVVERGPSEVERLRGELERSTRQRDDLRDENLSLKEDLHRADLSVMKLRKQLEPLYNALKSIWGELEEISPADATASPQAPQAGKSAAVWEAWKGRLGATVAKGIDALMIHGELNTQQLAIATGLNRNTITNTVILKLNKAGLINKVGGRFSLKQL